MWGNVKLQEISLPNVVSKKHVSILVEAARGVTEGLIVEEQGVFRSNRRGEYRNLTPNKVSEKQVETLGLINVKQVYDLINRELCEKP